MRTYNLDHNATTPMSAHAIQAMAEAQALYPGNASSTHSQGAEARKVLEQQRIILAIRLNCEPSELYFSSGGTEANNWAIRGPFHAMPGAALVYSGIEHKSILNTIKAVRWGRIIHPIKTLNTGLICLDDLLCAIRDINLGLWPGSTETPITDVELPKPILISVMLANNETGVIQPIPELVRSVRSEFPDNEIVIHADAVQAFGKIKVDVQELGVDAMTVSAHKLGGPKGVGALYLKKGVKIEPLLYGGHQEGDRRAGTENVAGARGFAVAAADRLSALSLYTVPVRTMRNLLEAEIANGLTDIWINGGEVDRLPNTSSMGFLGVDAEALLLLLSSAGIMVSTGSACEAHQDQPSHVLRAMGQDDKRARSTIRFSLSSDLSMEDVKHVARMVIESVDVLRGLGDLP